MAGVNPWQGREYQGAYERAYKAITRPFCIDIGVAIQGFIIDNSAASKALKAAKTRHARRWQTKEGTYKEQLPPDVRDTGDVSMADTSGDGR